LGAEKGCRIAEADPQALPNLRDQMRRISILLLFSLLFAAPLGAMQQEDEIKHNSIVKTIVIDPGHGGDRFPGAIGPTGLQEREVTLAISLKLKELILNDEELGRDGVQVILTREYDKEVSLEERSAIANKAKGDLYISIHCNGFDIRSAKGAETYFLSLKASDEHARRVAEIENQGFEDKTEAKQQEGGDDLKLILFDFIHKQYIAESKFLAEQIQAEFNASINNGDRGVKQSPLRVLKGVAMPAVLVEVDFISNPQREALLRSTEYQHRFASSMLRSIKEYKRLKERGYTVNNTTSGETRGQADAYENR
jgi:N-acetylmuramoyl-L-alanine amidase